MVRFQKRFQQYLSHPGGLPTTTKRSGQQWDFPNVWPPLEHLLIVGLHLSPCKEAQEAAKELGRRRVSHCLALYSHQGHLFEKYSCEAPGQAGAGGEYPVQLGFGWTNGALLHIMTTMDL